MSAPFRVRDAAVWSDARVRRGAEVMLHSVSIDTRTIEGGALFFAIRGPQHDAHRFLDAACEAGAAALVVEAGHADLDALPESVGVLEVEDTTRALAAVASGHRAGFVGPLVGLTGSSGKTTTKEMCAAVLGYGAPCLATRGNLNNAYGVPLTLLRRDADHTCAVVEMGMNHRGEIAHLAAIARPTVGLVTNIGSAHIEFLGSEEEIAREKGDLYAALPPSGIACANFDDPRVVEQAKRAPCPVLGYACEREASVRARKVRFFPEGRFAFDIETPEATREVAVRGLSTTTVINALAATTVALAVGRSLDDVAAGLALYEPIRGRMTPVALPSGATVIDDTYNANPQSMGIALESLRRLASGGRAIAVMGDMGELGDAADPAHREAGRTAAKLGVDFVFALGERAALVREGALEAGMPRDRVAVESEHEDIAERVGALAARGDWVLVKGSRAMQMERVVAALETREKNG